MTPQLSAEQQRAVERLGQDVCVVAGPGSGKTRVLIERFAWLVEHQHVDPTRILAITFTEKAAIEIKQRLITRFAARPDLRASIERAWVSTIHAFCARLLKEHAIEAGLSPAFTVLEQAPAERLQREAAEEALDALFTERPAEMRRLLEAVDLSTQDAGRQPDLAAALLDVYEAMRVAAVTAIPAAAAQASVEQEARRIAAELARGPVAGTQGKMAQEWAAGFLALPATLSRAHFRHLDACKARTSSVKHPGFRTLKKELLPQLTAEWLAAWYAGLDALLREALTRIGTAYLDRKRREAAVDFSDLEAFTVDLLERNPEVRRETRARFDHVLMDELQDTNRMQWRLVDLVRTHRLPWAISTSRSTVSATPIPTCSATTVRSSARRAPKLTSCAKTTAAAARSSKRWAERWKGRKASSRASWNRWLHSHPRRQRRWNCWWAGATTEPRSKQLWPPPASANSTTEENSPGATSPS